jgi:hypothetical protein
MRRRIIRISRMMKWMVVTKRIINPRSIDLRRAI